jgi:NADPH:quinone reductase-like Zn-dependent oxidoreductase
MRAAVFDRYGPAEVLTIVELPVPTPKANEVRIRVHAAGVSAEDPKLRAFDHPPLLRLPIGLIFGFRRPRVRILGMEFAGEVDAVGCSVERFRVGDQVFGYTGIGNGAHAEYRCLPEHGVLARKPSNASYVEAAALPNGALTALVYLRNMGRLACAERALIYGASGAVGTAAVQLAKFFGAHVTGVCSTRNLALVASLGADEVCDYTREDFTRHAGAYDVVFDTVGKTTFRQVAPALKERGRYLVTHFGLRELWQMGWTAMLGKKRILGGASNFYWTAELLEELAGLFQKGHLRSVVDRRYPLEDVVLAHRYVEQGHKRGNVVLTMGAAEAQGISNTGAAPGRG